MNNQPLNIADEWGETVASAELPLFEGEDIEKMWECSRCKCLHILTTLGHLYSAEFDGDETITITCEEQTNS